MWPFGERAESAASLIAERTLIRSTGITNMSRGTALRHSAVWAALRLRADMVSSMPLDVFRRIGGIQVEQVKPPVFSEPGGRTCRWLEWIEATQRDLDSVGNTVGIITAFDGLGLPARIELQPIDVVSIITKNRRIKEFKIDGKSYDPSVIWHEKQFAIAGLPVGLSPTAHAAMPLAVQKSAQEFAARWFTNGVVPGGHLRNTAKKLKDGESMRVKNRFKAMLSDGDLFVSGNDWEYKMIAAKASEAQFLEATKATIPDICRFYGVPADLIEASIDGSSTVTYANITERNLQFLILNLGPAITRREEALSYGMLPRPRYVKFNTNAIMRMDFKSRYEGYKVGIDGRFLPPSEVRELENLPPLTPEQEAEFARLFGGKNTTIPAAASTPDGGQ